MNESSVVSFISKQLLVKRRYHINVHGSLFSKNGTPDIMTMDADGVMLGIEVKRPGNNVSPRQCSSALDIIDSGGRFIIGYPDFSLDDVDAHKCRTLAIDKEWTYFDLYDFLMENYQNSETLELIR